MLGLSQSLRLHRTDKLCLSFQVISKPYKIENMVQKIEEVMNAKP
jgi:ACT domain-containing protein